MNSGSFLRLWRGLHDLITPDELAGALAVYRRAVHAERARRGDDPAGPVGPVVPGLYGGSGELATATDTITALRWLADVLERAERLRDEDLAVLQADQPTADDQPDAERAADD